MLVLLGHCSVTAFLRICLIDIFMDQTDHRSARQTADCGAESSADGRVNHNKPLRIFCFCISVLVFAIIGRFITLVYSAFVATIPSFLVLDIAKLSKGFTALVTADQFGIGMIIGALSGLPLSLPIIKREKGPAPSKAILGWCFRGVVSGGIFFTGLFAYSLCYAHIGFKMALVSFLPLLVFIPIWMVLSLLCYLFYRWTR